MKGCLDGNKTRIDNAKKKSMSSVKTRRRILRGVRKNKSDTTKNKRDVCMVVVNFNVLFWSS